MDMLTSGGKFDTSRINFLPFVNGTPSDYSTLYTAIKHSISEAEALGLRTCILTFDQPLYAKSRDIVVASSLTDQLLVVMRNRPQKTS